MSKIKNGFDYIGVNSGGTAIQYTTKVVDIGSWDMDNVNNKYISHGLSSTEWKTIIGIDGVYILDGSGGRITFSCIGLGNIANPSSLYFGPKYIVFIWSVDSSEIRLWTHWPDNSSTSINRGWITITYKPD